MRVLIDASYGVLGRIAARAAKTALNGDEVYVFNVEKIVISGSRKYLFERYLQRIQRGHIVSGPFFPKTPKGIVKRAIRGMISYKTGRGRDALKRVKVFEGVPQEFLNEKMESPSKFKYDFKSKKYLTVKQLSNRIGGS